jgi:3-oxoacyl-[acyl-carrier protein] reductase
MSSGKVAIVTGASHGIGRAIAHELASMGYSLGIVSRKADEIARTAHEIASMHAGVRVITEAFDVSDRDSALRFVARVGRELGDVSVLVNNAGEYLPGTTKASAEQVRRMMEVNYNAATFFVEGVVEGMRRANSGYILNIASICGVEAYAEVGAYCASKFALVGYSNALDQELAADGIKVTALCPSWVHTRMASASPLQAHQMIQPDDIAKSVRYLLSLSPAARVREVVLHCE